MEACFVFFFLGGIGVSALRFFRLSGLRGGVGASSKIVIVGGGLGTTGVYLP